MSEKTSFSVQTKDELARIYPEKPCCRLAELAAMVRLDGTVTLGTGSKMGLFVTTEYSAAARKVYRLLKDCFNIEGEITIKRQTRLKRHTLYNIRVPMGDNVPDVLRQLGILAEGSSRAIMPGIKKGPDPYPVLPPLLSSGRLSGGRFHQQSGRQLPFRDHH